MNGGALENSLSLHSSSVALGVHFVNEQFPCERLAMMIGMNTMVALTRAAKCFPRFVVAQDKHARVEGGWQSRKSQPGGSCKASDDASKVTLQVCASASEAVTHSIALCSKAESNRVLKDDALIPFQ